MLEGLLLDRWGGGYIETGILTGCMWDISYNILHFIKSFPNSGVFNIVDAVKFCCIHIRCYYQRGWGGTRAVSVMYGLAAPASDQYNRCTPTPGVRYVPGMFDKSYYSHDVTSVIRFNTIFWVNNVIYPTYEDMIMD